MLFQFFKANTGMTKALTSAAAKDAKGTSNNK